MGSKFTATALILAALVYTLLVLFAVLTVLGLFGLDALMQRPLEFLLVLLLAGSPVAVWNVCLGKARKRP